MRAFTYERVRSPSEAAAAAAAPGSKFIAGGTNLLDLMKLEIETPSHLIDVNGTGLDRIEATAGRRTSDRCTGPQHRPRGRPARAPRLRRSVARAAGRRFGTAAQPRHHRRQSPAAHALPVLLRHRSAVQQATAGQRLQRARRLQPPARDRRREQRVHRHPPQRHGGRHARARCHRRDHQARWHVPPHSDRRPASAPRQHARRSRQTLAAGRIDHGASRCLHLPAARTSTRKCATARRTRSRSSPSPPFCSPTVRAAWPWVASRPSRGASSPPRPTCRMAPKRCRRSSSPTPGPRTDTPSRSPSWNARSPQCSRKGKSDHEVQRARHR